MVGLIKISTYRKPSRGHTCACSHAFILGGACVVLISAPHLSISPWRLLSHKSLISSASIYAHIASTCFSSLTVNASENNS